MDSCLLCLQIHIKSGGYITLNSPQWFHFKILEKIEKHLWPIDSMQNIFGICSMCWSKLNDFHEFYRTIENAHQRNVQISKAEMDILQLTTHQNFKAEMNPTEESSYIIDELDNIKTEELFEGDESRVCVSMRNIQNKIDFDPISTEKRKRGRPKKYNIYESFTKKPKGEVARQSNVSKTPTQKSPKGKKRGRPRKINQILTKKPKGKRGRPRKYVLDINAPVTTYSKIVSNDANPSKADLAYQPFLTNEQETPQQSDLPTSVGRGSPQKVKRSRGRPRKIQNNKDDPKSLEVVHELQMTAPEDLNTNQQLAIQGDGETNEIIIQSNNTKKMHKKNNIFSLMKKRKQRRALMRNYIATSVLCMKFLKKD